MKKIKTVLMTIFVCALGYGSYSAYDYITMSDAERFLLQNIEALTSGEGGGSGNHILGFYNGDISIQVSPGVWKTIPCCIYSDPHMMCNETVTGGCRSMS